MTTQEERCVDVEAPSPLLPTPKLRDRISTSAPLTAPLALGRILITLLPPICTILTASAQEQIQPLTLGVADKLAASSAINFSAHGDRGSRWLSGPVRNPRSVPPGRAPGNFYPADINNPDGGATLQFTESNILYVNGQPADWGYPATILDDLDQSDMIHLVDQYVGSFASNRYTRGQSGSVTMSLPHTLQLPDILTLVHVAASQLGGGYGHINHIFLPQNQDVCVSGDNTATVGVPTGCYAPDNPSAFTWCAFHASVDFPDIGHVIFSIEPYQNVSFCVVEPQPSPNGALVDSTANSLSHELFEMITDPDTNAWLNRSSLHLFGAEIGDLCENSNFEYGVVQLNGRKYQFQAEYSNAGHVCAYSLNMH